MKKLLVLGSTPGCLEIIQRAKYMGCYVIVTDYLSLEESEEKRVADEYWMISTADIDELENKCRETGVSALAAGISDFNLDIGVQLSERLHLPWFCSSDTWHYAHHKADFKRLCRQAGVPVAEDYHLSDPPTEAELDSICFPIVVKPVDMSCNIGMSYCYCKADVEKACINARSNSRKSEVVAERMLHGKEYVAHYTLANGQAVLTGFYVMLSQIGYPANCYSFTTDLTDAIPLYLKEVHPHFSRLMEMAGCHDGVTWIEMILDDDGHFYVLEMAQRPTGDMVSVPLQKLTGFDTFQWMTELFLGQKHTEQQLLKSLRKLPKCYTNSYILWSDRQAEIEKVEGVDELKKNSGIYMLDYTKPGRTVREYSYLFVIAFLAESFEEICDTIRIINQTIRVFDNKGNSIVIYYDDFDALQELYVNKNFEVSYEDYSTNLYTG